METILDRRNDSRARVELSLPVELGHGGFDESFEADAVDLSPGGLALRSPCLPDLGSHLSCRFESVPEGRLVSVTGEVVWARIDGERGGEFGLRFLDIDPEDEALIEEMLAERLHKTRSLAPCRAGTMVKLQVEGAGGAIQARVAQTDEELTTFEQELDLLALGRAVLASQTYGHGRRGKIAHVDLRFEGATPLLAVTVSFAQGQTEYGEFRVTETARDAAAEPSDTAPDLDAPVRAAEAMGEAGQVGGVARSRFSQTTVTEFDAVDEARQGPAHAAVQARQANETGEDEHEDGREHGHGHGHGHEHEDGQDDDALPAALWEDARQLEAASQDRPAAVPAVAPVVSARPAQQLDLLDARAGSRRAANRADLDDDPIRHEFQPGLSPWLLRAAALRARVLELVQTSTHRAATFAALVHRVLGPRVLLLLVKTRGALGKLWRHQLAPFFGALRRLVATQFAPQRRTTAAPRVTGKARTVETGSQRLRTAGLVGLCAAALGLGAYAVWPSPTVDTIALHRPVQLPAESAAAAPAPAAPGAEPAALAQPVAPAQPAPAVPPPAVVPASSPYAATPAEVAAERAAAPVATVVQPAAASAAAAPAQTVVRGAIFGASDVPNAKRFVLRMSSPVKRIEGIPDVGGFTVIIPGSLALDRAGPISATVGSVSRAMILNKGDRAELTIRFAPGKSPRYRVQAVGQAIEVLIGG